MSAIWASGAFPGEMARRVEETDWSKTPLGPAESWPQSLKSSVATILASGFPMSVRWGPDLIFIYNDAFRSILGDKHPAALGRPLREIWWEIFPEIDTLNQAILRGERPAFFAEDHHWQVRRSDAGAEDARFTISYSPIPEPTAERGIGGILAAVIETTERVRKEEALRALNEGLEEEVAQRTRERDRIWRVSEDLLGVSNFDGYFISVNPAWTTLLGWSEDEIKRLHVSQLRHPDDAEHSTAGRRRLAEGVPTVRIENRFRHRDGSWRWVYWTMTAEQGLIYVIGRHVTAEKEAAETLLRTQIQLAQSQKMEALGQLTGGVAHDFNNMLMVVSGNAQILKQRLGDRRDRRAVEAIERASARGEHLTRQLLAFSRRQELTPTVIAVRKHLAAFRDVLVSSAPGSIRLLLEIPNDTWPVAVDLAEFELALVNLVINARDAMPEGGTITIAADNRQLRPADTADGLAGEFVALTVADTGSGIAADILPKVFEPFFTTKAERGTGLGLSQVYGFTRQSGGGVAIASRIGEGCTVTMHLPRSAHPAADRPADREQTPEGSEAVLLVEDNAEVGAVAEMLLRDLGYRVVPVDSAMAALATLASGEPIDLVFSDVVMPGDLDGLALARQIRARYPHLPIVLTSGYAKAVDAAEAGFRILRKPYRQAVLATAIREALDRAPPAPGEVTEGGPI
jgi:PAS domain S-box-containing protein